MTNKFGWLQASATKESFLSGASADPATIRILLFTDVLGAIERIRLLFEAEGGI
jgi:hypothetical protein